MASLSTSELLAEKRRLENILEEAKGAKVQIGLINRLIALRPDTTHTNGTSDRVRHVTPCPIAGCGKEITMQGAHKHLATHGLGKRAIDTAKDKMRKALAR